MVNEEIAITREHYDELIADRARLNVVRDLVSKTSYVSKSDLLVALGVEDESFKEGVKNND